MVSTAANNTRRMAQAANPAAQKYFANIVDFLRYQFATETRKRRFLKSVGYSLNRKTGKVSVKSV